MIQGLYFARPELLWALPPLTLLGLLYIHFRTGNKILALSRLLIFCLILAASANPYFVQTQVVQSERPSVTILEDKTGSMQVFDPNTAARMADLSGASIRTFSGDSTPLGDRILQPVEAGAILDIIKDDGLVALQVGGKLRDCGQLIKICQVLGQGGVAGGEEEDLRLGDNIYRLQIDVI